MWVFLILEPARLLGACKPGSRARMDSRTGHILSRKVQHFQPSSQLTVSGWATFVVFKDLGNCCPENRDCLPALRENRRDHPQGTPGCSHVWTGSEGFKFLPTVPKNSDWQNRNCQIDH